MLNISFCRRSHRIPPGHDDQLWQHRRGWQWIANYVMKAAEKNRLFPLKAWTKILPDEVFFRKRRVCYPANRIRQNLCVMPVCILCNKKDFKRGIKERLSDGESVFLSPTLPRLSQAGQVSFQLERSEERSCSSAIYSHTRCDVTRVMTRYHKWLATHYLVHLQKLILSIGPDPSPVRPNIIGGKGLASETRGCIRTCTYVLLIIM